MGLAEEVVLSPDKRLSTECEPVEKIDQEIRDLANHMLDIMYETEGCGLAAPQVGVLKQLVVIDCDWKKKGGRITNQNPYVLINPKIICADGDPRNFSEGCLSFPGISVDVIRPSHVVVQALDLDGDLMQYEAEWNLLAVCLQHEIDHLHGKTMVDHLAPIARAQAMKDYEEALAAGARPGQTEVEE